MFLPICVPTLKGKMLKTRNKQNKAMMIAFGLFHMACSCTKTLKSAESTESAFTFSKKNNSNAVFAHSKLSVERWTLHTLNRHPHWSSSWSLGTNFSVLKLAAGWECVCWMYSIDTKLDANNICCVDNVPRATITHFNIIIINNSCHYRTDIFSATRVVGFLNSRRNV